MLSRQTRNRVKYLSDNFGEKECREELMKIIKEHLNKNKIKQK